MASKGGAFDPSGDLRPMSAQVGRGVVPRNVPLFVQQLIGHGRWFAPYG